MNSVMNYIVFGAVVLFIFIFCISKLVIFKPHKLKKTEFFRATFKDDAQVQIKGTKYLTLVSKKSLYIPAVVLFVVGILLIISSIENDFVFLIFGIYSIIIGFVRLVIATTSFTFYDDYIEKKNIIKRKEYLFKDIDYIEVYNTVNAFNKGNGYGYKIFKDNKAIINLKEEDISNIELLEEVLRIHPNVTLESN